MTEYETQIISRDTIDNAESRSVKTRLELMDIVLRLKNEKHELADALDDRINRLASELDAYEAVARKFSKHNFDEGGNPNSVAHAVDDAL